jgi:hypothetical protein
MRSLQTHAKIGNYSNSVQPGRPVQRSLRLQRLLGNQGVQAMLNAPGQSLPPTVRAEMERRFGQDFGAVRVHTDADAARSAAELGARAYIVGPHVTFAAGHFQPESAEGRELLAHELAHVVQQSRGGPPPSSQPDSVLESAAAQAASAVVSGDGPVRVSGASGVGVARQGDDFLGTRIRRDLDALMLAQAAGQSGDPAQATMPLLSLLNGPFFGGNNPVGTLSTDIYGAPLAFQSLTDPSVGTTYIPSFTLQVRDRTSPTGEVGVFGSFGGVNPLGTPRNPTTGLFGPAPRGIGTGALGLSYHHGPEAPSDSEHYRFGLGYWLTLGQYWGLEPQRDFAPPGWSFNPTGNAMLSMGWARDKHGEFDLVGGSGLGRWGQVNGVPVGAFLSPYLGFSYTKSLGEHDSLYGEVTGGANLGLAGRYDSGSGFPASMFVAGGIGYQHTWGDYGFGVEPWVFAEPASTVATSAASGFHEGPFGNWGGGLRFNLTAINPRRRVLSDE